MLSWLPFEVRRNCDAYETVFFHKYLCFLTGTVLEKGSKPRVCPAGYVDSCCCDEVVPVRLSASCRVDFAVRAYHDVSVPAQCQKNITMNTTTAKKCAALKNS